MDLLLGKSEGIAIGKSEGFAEIAKKMKAKNMPIEQISEFTGLSKEEIERL
jgi:predicted transposase/invertase (TIGR01784 family)